MVKSFLFMMLLGLFLGCGQKSTIKNHVKAQKLANAYGDGENIIRNLTFPLSDSSLAYRTPLPGLGPIAGGIMRFVSDIFAGNTNRGKLQMTFTQPLPEIPPELNSVKMKRLFFYMKPQEKGGRFRDWVSRVVMGKGHVTFDFLDKLAIRLETVELEDIFNYLPTFSTSPYDADAMASLMKVFNRYYKPKVIDPEKERRLVLIRYDQEQRSSDTASADYGEIHFMESKTPMKTKHFLMDHPHMHGFFKRILLLEDSLLVELKKDPIIQESFKMIMSELEAELENLGVTYIDTCTPKSCLELKLPDVNLIPIARKGNGLKLDAVIHAGKVPESFNLKGFVEFEVKVESPI